MKLTHILRRMAAFLPLFFALSITAPAQEQKSVNVRGTVTDDEDVPLMGAVVTVQEVKDLYTTTDANGVFKIKVPAGSHLQISYVGFKPFTAEVVSGRPSMTVRMTAEILALEQSVVVGYGTARLSDVTGSISMIDGAKLTSQASPQLSAQLEGMIAGLEVIRTNGDPGSSASFRVRGVTTMSTNDPLIIVDGVPASSIDDVAPEDVETIQVLKDAAAASIYGARAAAGVILITTKQAKFKEFKMSYNFEVGVDVPTDTPKFANAVEWMTGLNELKYNDGAKTLYSAYDSSYIESYNANHINNPDQYPDTDWMGQAFKTHTVHTRHSFSMSGGAERVKTKFSIGYYDTDGLYAQKNFRKVNVRNNNDFRITDWIQGNIGWYMVYAHKLEPQSTHNSMPNDVSALPPIYNAYWSDGAYADGKDGENPVAALNLGGSKTRNNFTFGGKFKLDITPFKNFTISAVIAPNFYFNKLKDFRTKYQLRKLDGSYITGRNSAPTKLTETRNDSYNITKQLYLNYKLPLKKHDMGFMLGYEDYTNFWEYVSARRENYPLEMFPYLDFASETSQYSNGAAGHNAYMSFFGRAMYSYDKRYLLQVNVRTDGSSRFSKKHRWGTFPSASAGWVMSNESWFQKSDVKKVINYLKLRASAGMLGNERINSEFPYLSLITFGNNYLPNIKSGHVDKVKTAYQMTYTFDDITWETTTTYGGGLDLVMFGNRLKVTADGYYKKTTGMLIEIGFPSYFGYNSPKNNAADMHTAGWDLNVSWQDSFRGFNYGASVNLSDYRSRMGYMADKMSLTTNTVTMEGSYYQEYYLYRSTGIINNESGMYDRDGNKIPLLTSNDKPGCLAYVDQDGDGQITPDKDRVLCGNSLPEYQFGGSLWANYKGVDFSLSFNGVGHRNVYFDTSWRNAYYNGYYSLPSYMVGNRWSPSLSDEENSGKRFPMLTTANKSNVQAPSDWWLFNGAYLRVKNITLGYTLPRNLTKKILVSKLRFYFSANDLPAISGYPDGIDPNYRGGDFLLTSYIFGLNLTF